MKRIYPHKLVLIIGVLFITFSVFLLLIVGYDNSDGVRLFGHSLLFALAICILIFVTYQIKFDSEKITLIPNGFKGTKKFKINIKDIIRIEIREFKAWGKFNDYLFAIFFDIEGEEGAVIINNNMYFLKDIKELFDMLEREHNITYIRK